MGPGDPLERLERALAAYLDYHLTVGAGVMRVVQGESLRAGSKLGPRRRAFFDTMTRLLGDEIEKVTGMRVDPLVIRSLLVAVEGVSLMFGETESGFDRERARRVVSRIVLATIASPESSTVPALPLLPRPPAS